VLRTDPREPFEAELDYRRPLDAGEELELVVFDDDGRAAVAFVAGDVRAVARLSRAR
jgi:hypothetical protein